MLRMLWMLVVAIIAVAWMTSSASSQAQSEHRVYELRTYTANPGKLEALHKRFRDHTNRIFAKHGMTIVGFWVPQEEKDGHDNTLVYLLSFPSREAAKKSWDAFRADPEWQRVKAESEKDGVLVSNVKSVFMEPTDYSPLK
jgi:NIPSNAP protein